MPTSMIATISSVVATGRRMKGVDGLMLGQCPVSWPGSARTSTGGVGGAEVLGGRTNPYPRACSPGPDMGGSLRLRRVIVLVLAVRPRLGAGLAGLTPVALGGPLGGRGLCRRQRHC